MPNGELFAKESSSQFNSWSKIIHLNQIFYSLSLKKIKYTYFTQFGSLVIFNLRPYIGFTGMQTCSNHIKRHC